MEYIFLIMEQIAWVSRWFLLKKIYCQNVFVSALTESSTLQRSLFRSQCRCKGKTGWALHLIWTMLTRYNRWMVPFVDTCYVSKIIWQKKSNLMILDISGIDSSRMLLFVLGFLLYWKIEPNSHAFSRIRQQVVYDLISKRSHLNGQKSKMWRHRQQFLRFYFNK